MKEFYTDVTFRYTVTVSSDTGIAYVFISAPTGGGPAAYLKWQTNGSDRWVMGRDGADESGGNAGSPFLFGAYNDAGGYLGAVFTVTRATRVLNFTVAPTFTDQATTRTNLGLGLGSGVSFASVTATAGNIAVDRIGDAATGALVVQADAGQHSQLNLAGASDRWVLRKNNVAETGSNAGSNLELLAYSDAGALLGTVLSVTRSTRVVNFNIAPTFTDAPGTVTNLGLSADSAVVHIAGTEDITGAKTFSHANGVSATGGQLGVNRVGDAAAAQINISGDTAQIREIVWNSPTHRVWIARTNAVAESGSDVGSNFEFYAVSDANVGATVYTINRASRVMNFTVAPTFTDQVTTRDNISLGTGDIPTFAGLVTTGNYTNTGGFVHVDRTGDATGASFLASADAGSAVQFVMRTATTARWAHTKSAEAETGSNAGSNYNFAAYNDAGTLLGVVYSVARSTQIFTFTQIPAFPTAAVLDNTTQGANTAFVMDATNPYRVPPRLQGPLIGNVQIIVPIDGVTTPTSIGTVFTSFGTPTAVNIANTNSYTRNARIAYLSAATAGASAGIFRGAANVNLTGGFHLVIRFGVGDAAAVANAREFLGLYGTTTQIGNVEPNTLLNIIGIGANAGGANLKIMHNDGSGAATEVDLGANFPANTISTDFYQVVFYAAPGATTVSYHVTRLNSGHVASGTLSTNLPAAGTMLAYQCWRNNGATALAIRLDMLNLRLTGPLFGE